MAALAGMLERFCTTPDCVDTAFIPDGILDQLPQPTVLGCTRVGGIDLDKARTRHVFTAIVSLAAARDGFTVADLVAEGHATTGHDSYSTRKAAYDIRKRGGHNLLTKIGHRHRVPTTATRTIVAILTLRDLVISPIIAGVRVPRRGRPPATWTILDQNYENLRRGMTTLVNHRALTTIAA